MATQFRQFTAGVNPSLTNVALGRKISGGEALAVLFPIVPVPKEDGNFTVGGFEAFIPYNSSRARKAGPNKIDRVFGSDSYSCVEQELALPIDPRDVQAAGGNIANLQANATETVADMIKQVAAVDACTTATTAASYAAGWTGAPAVKWDNSGPAVEDILVAQAKVVSAGEGLPNKIVYGNLAWAAFNTNAQVISIWNQATSGLLTTAQAVTLLPGIEQIMVDNTVTRTPGVAGAGTPSMAFTADSVVIAKVSNSLPTNAMESSFGATFQSRAMQARDWPEPPDVQWVDASWIYDVKLLLLDAASDTKVGFLYVTVDT